MTARTAPGDRLASHASPEPPICLRPSTMSAPESGGWIPVGERLPDLAPRSYLNSVPVLVRVVSPSAPPRAAIDIYSGREQGWYVHRERVTHWQPLPSADVG